MYMHLGNSLNYSMSGRKRKKLPTKKPSQPKFERFVPKPVYRRETKEYSSLTTNAGFAAKPERHEYTGTLIKGISTMHKSNAVPIINEQEAIDIANMRRN